MPSLNHFAWRRVGARAAVWWSVVLFACGAAAQDGIFADFTTSLGNFTCRLDYTNAPRAVANFIGLATGQRAWLDLPTGQVRTNAFFDGLLFHRVISGFMIQGGSPKGDGSDGPGYAFPDEFTSSLRFAGFGVLAMANSGPNSNGSQFFVTVASASWLNDVHTIFGWVTSGTNVVQAISQAATDANDKPLTNVVIQNVAIRRVGGTAQAFDINGQNLPVVSNPGLDLASGAAQAILTFTNRAFFDNRLYASTNLVDWSPDLLGIELSTPATNRVYRAQDSPQGFYRLAQIQYPSSTFAPKSLFGGVLTLTFSSGDVITITFDGDGGGTYSYPPGPDGTVTSYDWTQDPYRGYLWPIYYSGLFPMTLRLDFNSGTAGNFSGTVYTDLLPTSVSGTFTLSP